MSAVINALRRLSVKRKRDRKKSDDEPDVKTEDTSQCDSGTELSTPEQLGISEVQETPAESEKMPRPSVVQRKMFKLSLLQEVKPRRASTFTGE